MRRRGKRCVCVGGGGGGGGVEVISIKRHHASLSAQVGGERARGENAQL